MLSFSLRIFNAASTVSSASISVCCRSDIEDIEAYETARPAVDQHEPTASSAAASPLPRRVADQTHGPEYIIYANIVAFDVPTWQQQLSARGLPRARTSCKPPADEPDDPVGSGGPAGGLTENQTKTVCLAVVGDSEKSDLPEEEFETSPKTVIPQ